MSESILNNAFITEIRANDESTKISACRNGLIDAVLNKPVLVNSKKVPNTELDKFKRVIEEKYNQHFESYLEFHKWSVDNYLGFWEEIWHYFGVICSKSYDQVLVKTGPGFLDNDWFSEAKFNFAENILRIRDNRNALICSDEDGNEEIITYAQMFEEVKLYASALRKHGVRKNDRVGFYMSNRKEAIFAMFATASIGALWGGPTPFYATGAASNILKIIEAKVLFTVDEHKFDRKMFHLIDNLEAIINETPTLEKVIIIPTNNDTLSRGISHIKNSCFLKEFLEAGKTPNGTTPDISFEQLPFNHPIAINFTSGTTGQSKAIVHSAGTFLALLRDIALNLNLKSGDTIYTCIPVGSSSWDYVIPALAIGVKLFLHAGCPQNKGNDTNVWDLFSRKKITHTFLSTGYVDMLEKENIMPKSGSNLDSLKVVSIAGSPVKKHNFEYLLKIKNDLFVNNHYGATEVLGTFSGFDFNAPIYAGEIQAPALGVDIKCFDHKGQSIIGQTGELVIATPTPSFPVFLWKDDNNKKINDHYLSKYEGVWSQNDECWINPSTNGIVVIGRSDDTLKQHGERFGCEDIYFAIHQMEELEDYICVRQDGTEGDSRAVLFVKLKKGYTFTLQLREKIANTISKELCMFYVPEVIMEAPDIPRNFSNKRMESIVRKIISTNKVPDVVNIKNSSCLQYFCNIPELLNY